jgi:hypothetical protein
MTSTRRSLFITGVLTAALVVVGFVGGAGAQTASLATAFSPASIDEPATGAGAKPKATLTVTLTNTGARGIVLIAAPGGSTAVDVTAMAIYGGTATTTADYTVAATVGSGTVYAAGVITFQRPSTGTETLSSDGAVLLLTGRTMVGKLDLTSVHDTDAEGDETAAVTVEIDAEAIKFAEAGATARGTVGTLGSSATDLRNAAILTITDNDNPGVSTLALEVDKALLKESGTTEAARTAEVKIKASRGQTFTTPQTIVLELGGDATKDVDYTIKKETLILDAGETEVDTDLIVLNDMVYDGPVMETVRISAFVGTVQLGETKTIHLEDNDQNPENFTLSVSPASVAEGETATVTVTAKAALAADQKFMLTVTGTATANEDFTLAPDLTVAKAATKGSTLLQAVKDSVSGEADETVMITATAGGIMVGTATVTIKGDTATPTTPTPTSDLGAPTIEDVKAGAKMLTVMWSAVEGATGYMVQWKTKSQSYGATRQASTTQMTHSIMELTNGMEYMVRVRGMKGDAYGKWSEEAMGTPTGETAVPTPALPVFGAFALAAGLVTAGRRRLRTRQRALLTD